MTKQYMVKVGELYIGEKPSLVDSHNPWSIINLTGNVEHAGRFSNLQYVRDLARETNGEVYIEEVTIQWNRRRLRDNEVIDND